MAIGDDNVSMLFAEKYKLLCNSVKHKNKEFTQFVYDNACDITNECIVFTRIAITRHSQ